MKTLLLFPLLIASAALPTALGPATTPVDGHDWKVDPVHSSVVFRVKHANAAWFFGSFDQVEGRVTLDPAAPERGRVELSIPVESVHTADKKRDGHLKSPDFFNSKENPDITFRSSKIERHGDDLHVTGELSIAGSKRNITIPVAKTGEGEFFGKRAGWMAEFTIKRSDFGMTYGLAEGTLGDEVTLMISLECVQPK